MNMKKSKKRLFDFENLRRFKKFPLVTFCERFNKIREHTHFGIFIKNEKTSAVKFTRVS